MTALLALALAPLLAAQDPVEQPGSDPGAYTPAVEPASDEGRRAISRFGVVNHAVEDVNGIFQVAEQIRAAAQRYEDGTAEVSAPTG